MNVKRVVSAWGRGAPLPKLSIEDGVGEEPVNSSGFSFGDLQLVGHGNITNDRCGTWSSVILGCYESICTISLRFMGRTTGIKSRINGSRTAATSLRVRSVSTSGRFGKPSGWKRG